MISEPLRDEPSRVDSARQHLAWLVHPITVAALVVLLINDHVVKSAYPGWITGKLSDIAGLVVAPALLASLVTILARRAPAEKVAFVAVAVVAAGFVVVKAFPAAAAVASAAWSVVAGPSLVLADLTDLLALPALGGAWLAWTRARHRPAPGRVARAVRVAVVAPVALAGVVATAKAEVTLPYAVGVGPGLSGHATALVARIDSDLGGRRYDIVLTSQDGRSWRSSFDALKTATAVQIEAVIKAAQATRTVACAADKVTCWRVVPGQLAVEESVDGGTTWTAAWSMSDPQRERYLRAVTEDAREVLTYAIGDLEHEMACTNVSIVPRAGTVVVACGLAGFVSRSPSGTWSMLGFDGQGPDFFTSSDGYQRIVILLSGLLTLLVGAEIHAMRRSRVLPGTPGTPTARGTRGSPAGIHQSLAILIAVPCLLCLNRGEGVLSWPLTLLFLAFLAVMTLVWLGAYLVDQPRFPWWTVPPAVLGSVIAGTVHTGIVRGQIGAMPGWIGIWSALTGSLAVAIALALLVRHREPTTPARWP